jgi:hypothetical protein
LRLNTWTARLLQSRTGRMNSTPSWHDTSVFHGHGCQGHKFPFI